MDVTFPCPNCQQVLEADSTLAGTEIACPICNKAFNIPAGVPASQHEPPPPPIPPVHHGREEKHFVVPTTDAPTQSLIKKSNAPLGAAVKQGPAQIRIKTIRRIECQEVGKDRFDELVTLALQKIGEPNIISLHTITYSHLPMESKVAVDDYGMLIVYRG
ncbi:MAG: hypothetical protein EXS23_06020 [Pedosphaera sp.]|nr:hypothetical protein [Pedosphaera sp.]